MNAARPPQTPGRQNRPEENRQGGRQQRHAGNKTDAEASLDALQQRIDRAEEDGENGLKGRGAAELPAGGMAMIGRIATEMLAGLITGGGIGWMLDQWLQTTPLFMLVLFILGGVAGMLTVWRMAMGYGMKIGYDRQSLTGNRENQNLTETPDSDVATSQVENTDTKSNTTNTTQTEQAD